LLEFQTDRRDVLAHFARRHVVAEGSKEFEQFAWNEMYLAKVGQGRLSPSKISMLGERPSVGVSLNAMAMHKQYLVPPVLAEIVPAIGGDRHDTAFEFWGRVQSHAA
jgi:hypothetical protein